MEDRAIVQERIGGHSGALFPLTNGRIGHTISHAVKKLKVINFRVNNLKQVFALVITNWATQENLREAQYRAGHRYISPTEKHKKNDLSTMRNGIVRFHPLE